MAARNPPSSSQTDREGSAEPAWWLSWLDAKISSDRIGVRVTLVLGLLTFIPFLGTLGLWDPWETHYGEVARAMVARGDWVYPHWEGAYFFSKPALTLWMMAFGLWITGAETGVAAGEPLGAWAEWGIRMPFAVVAIGSLWAAYRIGTHIRGRAAGVLAVVVLASCPQFILIGKQAMADGPLVGLMTAGMAFFIMAVFDRQADQAAPLRTKLIASGGILLAVGVQLALIAGQRLAVPHPRTADFVAIAAAVGLTIAFVAVLWRVGTRRDCWLSGFYVLVGLSALAKGLAVLAVVGPTVILYMLVTLDFRILARSKVLIGGVLFLLVAAPWYVTLTLFRGRDDEGLTFTQRFWMHDNFNRVGAGVHGDRAGLGYFLEQLAYGMFPWSATLPFALGLAARQASEEKDVERRRALVFVFIWALWSYVFFTLSQTKFHHYIFPAVPPLAILSGLFIEWIGRAPRERLRLGLGILVLALFIVAARDIVNDQRTLVNLFTYKYDRDFPRDLKIWAFIVPIVVAGGGASIVFAFMKRHADAVLAFVFTGIVFGAWVSHHHFHHLTPHWSQAHLFETYYKEKRAGEPIYAYQLNWRGENFYARNRILQVKESGANQRMRQLVDEPGREFIITEQSRYHTLRGVLSRDKRDKLQILDRSSNKFYLCVVEE